MGVGTCKLVHFDCVALLQSLALCISHRERAALGWGGGSEAITATSQSERGVDGSQAHPVLFLLGILVMVEMAGADATPTRWENDRGERARGWSEPALTPVAMLLARGGHSQGACGQ